MLFSFLLFTTLSLSAPDLEYLQQKLQAIDRESSGNIGLYVKRLSDGQTFGYQSERPWYLSSTVKVPIAIVLLQLVEKGTLSLEEKLVLQQSDYVDGMGELLQHKPGEEFSLQYLLEKMLTHSDSSATDMLIRRIGLQELNSRLSAILPGFHPLTTLLTVRHEAYGELHPKARQLSNMDFLEFKNHKTYPARLAAFRKKLQLQPRDLKAKSIEQAFERYYARNLNSGSLEAFGLLLEKLTKGELLQTKHTQLLLANMEKMVTGEHRLKAGLPKEVRFAQKTGTQIGRVCNVGIATSNLDASDQLVLAACVEKFEDPGEADRTLKKIGEALASSFASLEAVSK